MTKLSKVYYSISEVEELTGLEAHVLRYWESEFPMLKPLKNRGGNRAYRDKDIKLLFLIKKLLYHDRFTIEGARRQLSMATDIKLEQIELTFDEVRALDLLRSIREEIREVFELMEDLPGEVMKPGPGRVRKSTGAGKGKSQ